MTQPCKFYKYCRGFAYNRKAKLCAKCWKMELQRIRTKRPLEKIYYDKKNIVFEFKGEDLI